MNASVSISANFGDYATRMDGTRVHFSVHQCFAFDGGAVDRACIQRLASHLTQQPGLAVYSEGPLMDYILKHAPNLKASILGVIPFRSGGETAGLPALSPEQLPETVKTVFLCGTRTLSRMQMLNRLPESVGIVDPSILADIASDVVPPTAWAPLERNIYPIDLPEISLPAGKDLILMDCPARNLAMMPNGLAYVNNALKKSSISYTVFDLDIITYHRFHIRRLFDEGGRVVLASGRVLPVDPWQAEHYDLWNLPEVIDYFMPIIEEAAEQIIAARPKILGLSVQQCSEDYSARLVELVREQHPDVIVVVGGFSCYNADIGLKSFPQADYMCIGEADLTVGPLMEALVRGERPKNLAGVVSRYDDPMVPFTPAPMLHNLSAIEPPRYEWFDINVYRNYNGYQLVPIIASRGCRWSRCTFCAERFYWRIRDAKEFADEVEWLASQGCTLFMFNESDLNGQPEKLLEICDEIIKRKLNVKLTGQLRIHKKCDRAFFQKLRQAGFVALRFGVDAFSENTLRLQMKGYTTAMVSQNLKDCWEAGIFTEVNWVVGVPGETDADVDEGIQLILKNREYIGRLANINPLILVNGGVYWIDPESHNIVFRQDKEKVFAENPRVIPSDLWYSTGPYIDAQVRKDWFDRIVIALHDNGFPVGAWAARVIEDVKYARDKNRAGGAKSSAAVETISEDADEMAAGDATARAKQTPLVGEELPRLVRELGTHNIIFFKGMYYALPKGLGAIDLTRDNVANMPGVVIDANEDSVLAELELVAQWADSRGHFDAQEEQKAQGSYMRANSVAVEADSAETLVERPVIIRFDDKYYALDTEAVGQALSDSALRIQGEADLPPPEARIILQAGPDDLISSNYWRNAGARLEPAPGGVRLTAPGAQGHYAGVIAIDFPGVTFEHETCWAVLTVRDVVGEIGISVFNQTENEIHFERFVSGSGEQTVVVPIEFAAGDCLLFRTGREGESHVTFVEAKIVADYRAELRRPLPPRSPWHDVFNALSPTLRATVRMSSAAKAGDNGTGLVDGEVGATLRAWLGRPSVGRGLRHMAFNLLPAALRSKARMMANHLPTPEAAAAKNQSQAGSIALVAPDTSVFVQGIVSKDAVAIYLRTIDSYSLVDFDGLFYGVPRDAKIDWETLDKRPDPEAIKGLIVARSTKEATIKIEAALGNGRSSDYGLVAADSVKGPAGELYPVPKLLESVSGYDVVGYEGWIYGVPKSHGVIDLTQVDVTELSGVIRDVSFDVVLNEINYLTTQGSTVAAE